jgi:galactokinase
MSRPDPAPIDPAELLDRLAALLRASGSGRDRGDDVRVVRAPGRVNLIGEHTDYNAGLVLPAAIDLEVRIAFVPRADRQVMLQPEGPGSAVTFGLDAIGARRGAWIDYVAGTAWALAEVGVPTSGLSGVVAATLPREAGLSSSAALELAAAWVLAGEQVASTSCLDLARICLRAENEYVGVQCGLMDQFAVACGRADAALLLDCRSLEHRMVALPAGLTLVVCHTGSRRHLGASEYNARRAQCEQAVRGVAAHRPAVTSLRDLEPADLAWLASVLDEVPFRRARHVITENERVTAAVAALEAGDPERLGPIFAASHASLRDDYAVSSAELDLLVEIASATPGVVAARMTGAGFGGCTINLVRPEDVDRLEATVQQQYTAQTGLEAQVIPVRAAAGAGFVGA